MNVHSTQRSDILVYTTETAETRMNPIGSIDQMIIPEESNPTIILIMINSTIDNSLEIINRTNTIALIPRKGENIQNHGATNGTAAEIVHMDRIRVHGKDRVTTTIAPLLLHGTPKHH